MKKSPVFSATVATQDGDILAPRPMATYCEPSQRAIIRARDQQALQRSERNRNEAMALLRQLEMEEWLPQHDKESAPELPPLDPVLNADFLAGLIADSALAAVVALWLIFSSGGIDTAKAPPACAAMLDQCLIQVRPGKIPCYCVGPLGYAKVVRL